MPSKSKAKGNRFERECVNKAIEKAKDDECNRLKEKLQISQLNFDEIKKENEHLISCMENDSVNEVDDCSLQQRS